MTPATFMSISQQSKPKSSPNKLGWKVAFDPRADRSGFSTSAQLFSAEVSLGGFTSSYNWNCWVYWGFRNHRVGSPKRLSAKPNKPLFSESLQVDPWVIVIQNDKSSSLMSLCQAFAVFSGLGRPVTPLPALCWGYDSSQIPADHSCVWHFKEDYENEMW